MTVSTQQIATPSWEHYKAAWERLSTALWVTNVEGEILWVNPAAEMLIGRSAKALKGERFEAYFPNGRDWLTSGLTERGASGALMGEVVVLASGGQRQTHPALVVLSPLDVNPQAVLWEMTLLDEPFRMERDRITSEVMEANRQLLRNLAHEIKNPLGGIRGAAQLLELGLTNDDDRECTSVIVHETDRLQHLVDRFLAPYRQSDNVTEVNVHAVLEHVRQLIALEYPKGLDLERDYDISSPPVLADESRLTQVFLNLVRNAAQALDAKRSTGEAVIRLRTRIVRDVPLGLVRQRRALSIDVEDNGPGVPDEMKEKIFYPLVTGRADGTGLGLSLAKTFVHQMGGTLSVTSEPGKTIFSVLLPLDKREGREKEAR